MNISKHTDEFMNLMSRFDGMVGDLSAAYDRTFCVPCYRATQEDCDRVRAICDALAPIVERVTEAETAALVEDGE